MHSDWIDPRSLKCPGMLIFLPRSDDDNDIFLEWNIKFYPPNYIFFLDCFSARDKRKTSIGEFSLVLLRRH